MDSQQQKEFDALRKDLTSKLTQFNNIADDIIPKQLPKKIRLKVNGEMKEANVFISRNNVVRIEFLDPIDGELFYSSLK